jgi:hypothetical protein
MALSTVLQIVQRACKEMGLPSPSAAISSTDAQIIQIVALINRGGWSMMREHHWRDLITLGTITTVSGTSDYAYPSDFDRLVPETAWDRTNDWPLQGPLTPQADRFLRESAVSQNSPRRKFRMVGGSIRVFPTPTSSGDTLIYEYVSKKWARSSGSVAQTEFEADTDTSVFDPYLHVLDAKWRFMLAKGLDANAMQAEFLQEFRARVAADKGPLSFSLARDPERTFIDHRSIPDSGFGS